MNVFLKLMCIYLDYCLSPCIVFRSYAIYLPHLLLAMGKIVMMNFVNVFSQLQVDKLQLLQPYQQIWWITEIWNTTLSTRIYISEHRRIHELIYFTIGEHMIRMRKRKGTILILTRRLLSEWWYHVHVVS